MRLRKLLATSMVSLFAVSAALGQTKPNFSGKWEWVSVERNGSRIEAAGHWKESHVIQHQEPILKIKMFVDGTGTPGYRTLDLTFVTGHKEEQAGTQRSADGIRQVIGSAHWEGNKLVYEQAISNEEKGTTFHIIRSMELRENGTRMVAHHRVWTTPTGMKDDATEFSEKRPDAP